MNTQFAIVRIAEVRLVAATLFALFCAILPSRYSAFGQSGFRFQGYLREAGYEANGLYDFRFSLFSAANAGAGQRLGNPIELQSISVLDGAYDVVLDFGRPVVGTYLEIEYRRRNTADFQLLATRVPIANDSFGLIGRIGDVKVGVPKFGQVIDYVKEKGGQISDFYKERQDTFINGVKVEVGRSAQWVKENVPLLKYVRDRMLLLFMDPPTIDWITCDNPKPTSQEPVYFVNGMLTTHAQAAVEAFQLSCDTHRPVGLIYNRSQKETSNGIGTTGTPQAVDDLHEAIYDRIWPETLGGGADLGDAADYVSILVSVFQDWPPDIGDFVTGGSTGIPFVQLNPTTRQLTHLIYYAQSPITLVTHSQGNLIARNAFFTAGFLGKENWLRNDLNVTWVGTGVPLSDHEFWPIAPDDLRVHPNDCAGTIVGIRGNISQGCSLEAHDFVASTDPNGPSYERDITQPGSVLAAALSTGVRQLASLVCVDGSAVSRCSSQPRFQTIGQATNAVAPGGTIVIHAGTYREPLWLVNKKVLITTSGGSALIDPESSYTPGFGLPPPIGLPKLSVNKSSSLNFIQPLGSPAPPTEYLAVANDGGDTPPWSWSATSNAIWLKISPSSGSTSRLVSLTIDSSGLGVGTYVGRVAVVAANSANSPWQREVRLTIIPAESGQPQSVLQLFPSELNFTASVSGTLVLTQSVVVNSGGPNVLQWKAESTVDWLTIAPATGQTPDRFEVTANVGGFPPGRYAGTVTISSLNGAAPPIPLSISLTVQERLPGESLMFLPIVNK